MTKEHGRPDAHSTAVGTPATPSDAAGTDVDAPDRVVAAVNASADRILRAFDEKIRYDTTKQQAIDRQHAELVGHRRDLVAQAAAPFVFGMIHHHAEIGKLIVAVREESAPPSPPGRRRMLSGIPPCLTRAWEWWTMRTTPRPSDTNANCGDVPPVQTELPAAKVCELLQSLQEDIEHVLGENGVAAYRPEVNQPFDPERHRVVGKTRPTDDEARSGTIVACRGPGFERGGRILVKAPVSAYRYERRSPDS